jgi:hypothetical protein
MKCIIRQKKSRLSEANIHVELMSQYKYMNLLLTRLFELFKSVTT